MARGISCGRGPGDVVWPGAGVTARWEASYPFLRADHEKKEKSVWGQNRLSSPARMTALSSVTGSSLESPVHTFG